MKFHKGKLLNRREVYSGRIIEVLVDEIEIAGGTSTREVIRHPGGVVAIAEVAEKGIPFVRQYRYPLEKPLLELPAGRLEPDEEPMLAAIRELEEETGYRALEMTHVSSFYTTPGFCDEILHLFYAQRLEKVEANPEFDEQLVVEYYRLDDALDAIAAGRICDAKTMIALYWLDRKRQCG